MIISNLINPTFLSAIGNLITAFVSIFTITIYVKHTRYLLKQTKNAEEQLNILRLQLEDDRLSRQMQFHSNFQKKLREIQFKISELALKDDDEISDIEIDNLLNQYWTLVFDEWFICSNGGDDLKILWEKYYTQAVIYALQNPIYKEKIEKEFNDGRSFLGLHREFKQEINELSWKAVSKGLVVNHN